MRSKKTFFNLLRWEFEEHYSLPILVFLISSAIILVLAQSNLNIHPERNFINLYNKSGSIFFILTIIGSAFFSRTFAGSIEKGKLKLLLSYPIKRWQLFFSKFSAMFIPLFIIYGTAFSINIYLDHLRPLEPLFFLSLFAFLLHLMVVSSVSISLSMVIKNEILSMMASILLIIGIENLFSIPNFFSTEGRLTYQFQYFGELSHNIKPFGDDFIVTSGDVIVTFLIPILIFSSLFVLSFIYFKRFMEID
ncbi:MAG: ABC transporter permease subunit [Clostridiales bacterium]|nr:ABC transporter permease subunit [Clostridiales bacterium]